MAITLVIAMIFSSSVFAFADDETAAEVLQGSSASVELSESEIEFINNASSDYDREIRTLAVDVVRATSSTYTIDDVYGLLIALITSQHNMYEWKVYDTSIYNQINNNFSHYDSASGNTYDTGAMLWNIRQTLNDIELELVPAAASNLPSIYELISSIDDALTNIISAIPQPVDYTSALFYHNIGIAQMFDSFKTNNLNFLYTINNNVSSIVTNTSDIKSNTDNLVSNTNNIHNELGSSGAIASGISSLQSDFNYINWHDINGYNGIYSYPDFVNQLTGRQNAGSYYALYNYLPNTSDNYILRFYIPITAYSSPYYNNLITSANLYYLTSTNSVIKIPIKYYSFDFSNTGTYVYFATSSKISTYKLAVNFITNQRFDITDNYASMSYISQNDYDYFTVYNWLIDNYISDTVKIFKELYASDDIIASKEAQQPLEDAVLDDFTGSGSASASLGDALDVKGIQSEIKDSLTISGVNASGLSTILDSSQSSNTNSFFYFFSQDCFNDINGINNIPQTRDVYVFLDDSDELSRLKGGSSW